MIKYYKNITSLIGEKCDNIKRYTIMNSTKSIHKLAKKNSRDEQRAWKELTLDGLMMIYASAVHLWSAIGRVYKHQALRSWHADPGESETLPMNDEMRAKRRTWTSTCVSINSNRKHALKIISWAHAYRSRQGGNMQGKSGKISYTSSNDRSMRLVHQKNNLNKETLIYINHTRALHVFIS